LLALGADADGGVGRQGLGFIRGGLGGELLGLFECERFTPSFAQEDFSAG
jgi:hypothetical protein